MEFLTGGNQYAIYIYAYNGSNGNYTNETVHKMRYGATADCVTFPGTISNEELKKITFNARFYADLYEDLKQRYHDDEYGLWMHYLKHGIGERRVGSPVFDVAFYLSQNRDVAKAYSNNPAAAFYHWTTYGYKEQGRNSSPTFSAKFYLKNNPDVARIWGANNCLQATIHMNTYGYSEFRNSSEYYWGTYYKASNPDLSALDSYNLLLHYYRYSKQENRIANTSRKLFPAY